MEVQACPLVRRLLCLEHVQDAKAVEVRAGGGEAERDVVPHEQGQQRHEAPDEYGEPDPREVPFQVGADHCDISNVCSVLVRWYALSHDYYLAGSWKVCGSPYYACGCGEGLCMCTWCDVVVDQREDDHRQRGGKLLPVGVRWQAQTTAQRYGRDFNGQQQTCITSDRSADRSRWYTLRILALWYST